MRIRNSDTPLSRPVTGHRHGSSRGSRPRTYENRLKQLDNPPPLLADYPEFIEPVRELRRFEAPLLVNDEASGPLGPRLAVFLQRPRHHRNA